MPLHRTSNLAGKASDNLDDDDHHHSCPESIWAITAIELRSMENEPIDVTDCMAVVIDSESGGTTESWTMRNGKATFTVITESNCDANQH